MAQNPMAVLAAMLGGGFSGYADTKVRQKNDANEDRLFGLQYDKFKDDSALNRDRLGLDAELGRGGLKVSQDRFGLDAELGRGGLKVNQDRLGLDNRLGSHNITYDWARLKQDADQRAADRASDQTRARITAGATTRSREEADRLDRENLGSAYLQQWQKDQSKMGLLQQVSDMAKSMGTTVQEAAYFMAKRDQSPGGPNYILRDDPDGAGSGARPFVASPQGGAVAPAQQDRPTTTAEWDARASELMDAGKSDPDILKELGARPVR